MALKNTHVLISATCEYVSRHGKKDLAEVIKGLKMGRLSGVICVGPKYSQESLKEGAGWSESEKEVRRCYTGGSEDVRGNREPRNAGCCLQSRRRQGNNSPYTPQKKRSSSNTLILA